MIMMERSADPLLQLEIDEWILDYLIFSAIKALLEDYKSSKGGFDDAFDNQERASVCLQLVDCKQFCIPIKCVQPSSCQEQPSSQLSAQCTHTTMPAQTYSFVYDSSNSP